jgi:hypothetical protein
MVHPLPLGHWGWEGALHDRVCRKWQLEAAVCGRRLHPRYVGIQSKTVVSHDGYASCSKVTTG